MVYGYIRVSTDKQNVENQRYEINEFVKKEGLMVDVWVEETISGSKDVEDRKLGYRLKQMTKGDILICAELSRLGRNMLMIMGLLNQCMKREIEVWTIKDNYRLGNDISSKVLAFAFGLSAEIERNLISQRTKEALARCRAEGKVLGRPKGSRSKVRKLTGKEHRINQLLEQKESISSIARKLKVHRLTVTTFVRDFLLKKKNEISENRVLVDGKLFLNYKNRNKIVDKNKEVIVADVLVVRQLGRKLLGCLRHKLEHLRECQKDPTVGQLLSIWRLGHNPL